MLIAIYILIGLIAASVARHGHQFFVFLLWPYALFSDFIRHYRNTH